MPLPEKDEMFNTKNKMLHNIEVSFGGRIAEELIFGDVTTGASQDIKAGHGRSSSVACFFQQLHVAVSDALSSC